jgi:type IV secretion system protein TrbE
VRLSSYRPSDHAAEEHLRYILHDGNGIVRLKPNGFMVGYEFRGPDLLGTSWEELTYHADAVAQIFSWLDSRWTIHASAHHRRGGAYPHGGSWPDRTIFLLDHARRSRYELDGDHFHTVTRLWLSWQPLSARRHIADWLFGEERITNDDRATFERHIEAIESSLRPLFRDLRRINFERLLIQDRTIIADRVAQCLGEEMYGNFGTIASDPEEPIFLSHILSSPIALRPDLKIGERYIGVVAVRGYPRLIYPAILDNLRYLPVEFRFSVRIMPYAMPEASNALTGISRQHLLATLGLGLLLNRGGQGEEEETPAAWRQEVKDARIAAQSGESFCALLPQVIVYADTPTERDEATQAVRVAFEQCGMRPKIETWVNRFHAYLASLPGERDANELRYARASVRGATRLCTLTSTWHGPEHHPDARFADEDLPLTMMSTPARELFRLLLHVGDVGHTLIIGRTGRGKSVLFRAIENAHLSRYRGARVLSFDIGRSAYKYARAINGHHYTLQLGSGPQVAPLTGLNDPEQFDDLAEWLTTFAEVWRGKASTVKEFEDLRLALTNTREAHIAQGARLSDLGRFVQSPELRIVFEQVEGSLLDAPQDHFNFEKAGVPYWCFEIGTLGIDNTRWTVPTILYLQRRAFAEFARGDHAPTLLTIDEGARALKIPRMQDFAERIQREGRKNRVQFLFATQGVGEILCSPIRNVLIEQTPTKIALANREANGEELRKGYLEIGFSADDVTSIASMGEYDVLIRNEYGVQIVQLNPTEFELLAYGGASNEDCDHVDSCIKRFGHNAWLSHYLKEKGGDTAHKYADIIQSFSISTRGENVLQPRALPIMHSIEKALV